MEYGNNIDTFELGMTGIVFTLYIVGKVWMYYRIEDKPTERSSEDTIRSSLRNKIKNTKVIKRGNEWD